MFVISILDTANGARVHKLAKPNGEQNWTAGGEFTFSKDALMFASSFDEQGRVMRFPLATWNAEFCTDPSDARRGRLVLSKDEQWMVSWDESGYEVFGRTGLRYASRSKGDIETRPGYWSGLQVVRISPDSTQLVLSSVGHHEVKRLPSQATIHESKLSCMCGDFSPNGKRFWKTCTPFRGVNTSTWEDLPDPIVGHHREINSIAFSPDGRKVATSDDTSLLVWDIGDLTRPQELVAAEQGRCITPLAWAPDGSEIWAGDSWRYLRWSIPPRATGKPIAGRDIFPSEPKHENSMRVQFITPLATPGGCLVSSDEGMIGGVEMRNVTKSGVARKLRNLLMLDFLTSPLVLSKDRTTLFYCASGKIHAVNIDNDHDQPSDSRHTETVVGIGGQPARLVLMQINKVVLVDAASLQNVGVILPPSGMQYSGPSGTSRPVVSPDGHWLFCNLARTNDFDVQPALVDLQAGKVQTLAPVLESKINVAAFSPDSRIIAAGHRAGALSLWNVAGLAAMGGAGNVVPPPAVNRPPTAPINRTAPPPP
jgi:WD40 repeat protein